MIGYDSYNIDTDNILEFLYYCHQKKIVVHHLEKQKDGSYCFYCPITQRMLLRKLGLQPIKSVGILHYLLLLLSNGKNIIGIIVFMSTVLFCTTFLFEIRIIGNNSIMNEMVESVLEELDIVVGSKKQSYQDLVIVYDLIKDQLKQDIDYLNIYQTGSILNIEYTLAKGAEESILSFENIVATKPGIIQRIEVEDGNVLVSINDYVEKGDILVSNTIVSTNEEVKIIPVSGNIYAYTYQRVLLSKEPSNDEGEDFAYLLMQARSSLTTIDKIDKEIILEYDIINGERVLEIQYVCIENIGARGDINEESN